MESRKHVERKKRSEKSSNSETEENIERVGMFVGSDSRLTLKMLGKHANLNRPTANQILTGHLYMRKICAEHPTIDHRRTIEKHWLDLLNRIINEQDCFF